MTSDANKKSWLHRVFGPAFVFGAYALEFAAMAGFISGAAIVAMYGKFLGAAAMLFFALLCFLRIKRGRVEK